MVLLPVGVLVALALAVPAKSTASVGAAFASVAAGLLGLALVRSSLPDEYIWPNSEVMRRCRWLASHLESKSGWESLPVVILAGSSATMFGIDPAIVERRLSEEGKPATVLSFAMSGATLHERRYMLQSFLRLLGNDSRRKLASADIIALGEVFDAYDENPLYRMEKEAFSERLIQFLNPENAWKAWQAYALQCGNDPGQPLWSMALLSARHVLLNTFAVGALSGMEWPFGRRKKTEVFFPLGGRKHNFDYDATARTFVHSDFRTPRSNPALPFPQASLSFDHMLEPLQSYPYRSGFYALPMLEPDRLAYAEKLRQSVNSSAIFIGPPSRAEIESMLSGELWFDGVHPTGEGAKKFSDWFADRLSDQL